MNKTKNTIVLDIETSDIFGPTKRKPTDLNMSVLGVYSYVSDTYKAYTADNEKHTPFDDFWKALVDEKIERIVTYNGNHFDLPIIQKYAPEGFNILTDFESVDIMREILMTTGSRHKLDNVAKGCDIEQKSASGLDAVKWWNEGKHEKVKEYCIQDVKVTRLLHEHCALYKSCKIWVPQYGRKIVVELKGYPDQGKQEKANY